MIVSLKDNKKCITFESDEEIHRFCEFYFDNDYFIRKAYKYLSAYTKYIWNIKNGELWVDTEYHDRLLSEFVERILSKKEERKDKLKRLNLS